MRSAIGEGTTFVVHLPAEVEPPAREDSTTRRALRGRCVLVVGRSSLRDTLEPALVRLGLDHEWVTSGAAANQAGQRKSFEVALVDADIRTPEAVVRGLEAQGPADAPEVILFKADEDSESAEGRAVDAVPLHDAARAVVEALMSGSELGVTERTRGVAFSDRARWQRSRYARTRGWGA